MILKYLNKEIIRLLNFDFILLKCLNKEIILISLDSELLKFSWFHSFGYSNIKIILPFFRLKFFIQRIEMFRKFYIFLFLMWIIKNFNNYCSFRVTKFCFQNLISKIFYLLFRNIQWTKFYFFYIHLVIITKLNCF